MDAAFKTWNADGESLEAVEARIHDGVPREKLRDRASGYVESMFRLFPWLRVGPENTIVEVGPGVGYVMEAMAERTGARLVLGLDVAPGMIAHGRARIERDGLSPDRFQFVLYDGVTFPWPDDTIDFFWSVAAIQHIPKPFAYNVLLEMERCLKPGGMAAVHLLGWEFLARQPHTFAQEVRNQIRGEQTHWHHFYDREELEAVLTHGLRPASYRVTPHLGSIWVAWKK